MAMSALPPITSSQPSPTKGGQTAQDEQPADDFAKLFAQASRTERDGGTSGNPGTRGQGASQHSPAKTAKETDAKTPTTRDDAASALLMLAGNVPLSPPTLPTSGDAGAALGAPAGDTAASRQTLATLLTSNDANGTAGLGKGLPVDSELAGFQQFQQQAIGNPNPLSQAITQAQQGGLVRSLSVAPGNIRLASSIPTSTHGQATLQQALTGHSKTADGSNGNSTGLTAGIPARGDGKISTSGGDATSLTWMQQLQTQTTSPSVATGTDAGQGQLLVGDWQQAAGDTSLASARANTLDTSTAAPLAAHGTGTANSQSPAVASASVAQTPTLSAPLASAEWQQGLGQQLINLQQRGDQQMRLHLHPAELGPLSIHLKLDDQMAQAQFMSNNPHVRAAVEQAIPQLREALGEAGIQLGEAMVGDQQQPGQHQDGSHDTSADGATTNSTTLAVDSLTGTPLATTTTDIPIGGVDLYA